LRGGSVCGRRRRVDAIVDGKGFLGTPEAGVDACQPVEDLGASRFELVGGFGVLEC